MKKEERQVFIELGKEISASLCTFCHYGNWQAEGCCEGYNECSHPIEELSYENKYEEGLEPDGDCYGFKKGINVSLAADLTGAIISQGFDEWFYRKYSPTSVTVYGRSYCQGKEKSGKVRIG